MHRIALSVALLLSIFLASPASAQVVITQAKALAGNVTPGDTAGYPITLSQAGAYVLGSNLTVPSGLYGIYAGVDNIDIDLNGFTISGGSGGTYALITYKGQGHIHGGVIKSFRSSGLFIRGDAWTIEDMKIVQNSGHGVDASGRSLTKVQNSLVAVNGLNGIATGPIGSFRNNEIVNNAKFGISCLDSCHAEGNLIDLNKDTGIYFYSGMIINNTVSRNSGYGISGRIDPQKNVGYSNNMLIGNNPNGNRQVFAAVEMLPNKCVDNPCDPPS